MEAATVTFVEQHRRGDGGAGTAAREEMEGTAAENLKASRRRPQNRRSEGLVMEKSREAPELGRGGKAGEREMEAPCIFAPSDQIRRRRRW